MIKNNPKAKIVITEKDISIEGDKMSILSALGAFALYLVDQKNFDEDEIIEAVSIGLALSRKNRINDLKDLLDLFK